MISKLLVIKCNNWKPTAMSYFRLSTTFLLFASSSALSRFNSLSYLYIDIDIGRQAGRTADRVVVGIRQCMLSVYEEGRGREVGRDGRANPTHYITYYTI